MTDTTTQAVTALVNALRGVMVGGNHLVTLLPDNIPEPETDPLVALEKIGAGNEYDAWCCWRSIMLARAALDQIIQAGEARAAEVARLPRDRIVRVIPDDKLPHDYSRP